MVPRPEGEYVYVLYRTVDRSWFLRQRQIDVQDEGLSDVNNGIGNSNSSIQTSEKEVDDGRYEHGGCRTVRKPSPPVKFRGSGLVEK